MATRVYGKDSPLSKTDATTAPTVNDDNLLGYEVGSHWVDLVADTVYVATDVTTGAANWAVATSIGVTDHGALTGLADDDHTQYHNDTRGDVRYYTKTEHIATSAGAGDTGKPIKLDADGQVDATMINSADVDHGTTGGLTDDDHTQYLLLAGRLGGQTIVGDTASGGSLNINSTAHATKGTINFGSGAFYIDEANGNVAVGKASSDAWSSLFTAIDIGGNGRIASTTSAGASAEIDIGINSYFDGTNHKYISTDEAAYLQMLNGKWVFRSAPSGTAGTNITYTIYWGIENNAPHMVLGENITAKNWGTGTSAVPVLELPNGALSSTRLRLAGGETNLSLNAYNDGTWKYTVTDEAARINMKDGVIQFDVAASGTQNTAITWINGAQIDVAGRLVVQQQAYAPTATLTDAASIAWNTDGAQVAKVTLGGNRTMAAPTNLKDGATYILRVIQDATGSRTLAYNSVFKWPGGTAPVLTTTANAVDILTFTSDGTNLYGVAQLDFS